MIEANLLLDVTGKTSASFSVMDTLRFPLGILSGIGFIGAGAIVRRGRLVTGVTTAATLWLVTVIGLIVGGGYIELGLLLTAIPLVVLFVLKRVGPGLRRATSRAAGVDGKRDIAFGGRCADAHPRKPISYRRTVALLSRHGTAVADAPAMGEHERPIGGAIHSG